MLRVDGLLLDVHPAADHKRIERLVAGQWEFVGTLRRTDEFLDEIAVAEGQLDDAVEAGLFTPEHRGSFDRTDYLESRQDWVEYLEREAIDRFVGDDVQIDDALLELDSGTSSLRMTSTYVANTYRRSGAS